jgi:predicted MarR family transcription regulator
MHKSLAGPLAVCLAAALAGSAPAQDEVRALVEKAVRAHGGEKNLAKLAAMRLKCRGTAYIDGQALRFTAESLTRLPDRDKRIVEVTAGGGTDTWVFVSAGKKSWKTYQGDQQPVTRDDLAGNDAALQLARLRSLLPLLHDRSLKLSHLGEITVEGRPAVGVKVTAAGHKDVDLYFDKASGLLVKSVRWGLSPDRKEVSWETYYRDYQEIDGVRQPMKYVQKHDGKTYTENEVVEVRLLDRIDDAGFDKP